METGSILPGDVPAASCPKCGKRTRQLSEYHVWREFETVCVALGVAASVLQAAGRNLGNVNLRWAVAKHLRDAGAKWEDIGLVLKHNHSSMIRGVRMVEQGLKSSDAGYWRGLLATCGRRAEIRA